jgi:hypothetical protein
MAILGSFLKDLMINEFKNTKRKKGPYLYHVNTVQTAITFLNNNGLLSRGAVEELGLKQTEQQTDAKDKAFGIYYDVFLDSCDIHYMCGNYCYYGPVSFRYNVDLLDDLDAERKIIEVTKSNPISWDNNDYSNREEHYFNETSIQSPVDGFTLDNFKQHVTIVNMHDPLSFTRLDGIRLDEPDDNEQHQKLFIQAKEYLKKLVEGLNESNGLNISFSIRNTCKQNCCCKENYKIMNDNDFYKFYGFEE